MTHLSCRGCGPGRPRVKGLAVRGRGIPVPPVKLKVCRVGWEEGGDRGRRERVHLATSRWVASGGTARCRALLCPMFPDSAFHLYWIEYSVPFTEVFESSLPSPVALRPHAAPVKGLSAARLLQFRVNWRQFGGTSPPRRHVTQRFEVEYTVSARTLKLAIGRPDLDVFSGAYRAVAHLGSENKLRQCHLPCLRDKTPRLWPLAIGYVTPPPTAASRPLGYACREYVVVIN